MGAGEVLLLILTARRAGPAHPNPDGHGASAVFTWLLTMIASFLFPLFFY